jgi:acetylornithine deacetylase/succinyl-diaminopimelate desuccinylase family protein
MGLKQAGAMIQSGVVETLAGLVRINSVNPAYPRGCPETEIQAFVLDFFRSHGIAVREQEVAPGRSNIIACIPGRHPRRRIVFEAHSDTAGIEAMTIPPFLPEVRDGLLYGRGACDTKGGLAAMMHALVEVKRSGVPPPCDVWVVAAADEEFACTGVLRLREGLTAGAAVVSEPTDLRLTLASNGCLRWRITVRGKAAHSSKPHLGVNAITAMVHVVAALEADRPALSSIRHPLVGSPTLNIGTIRGGTQVNAVPDCCSIEIDRRLIPGESHDLVLAHYRGVMDRVRRERAGLEVAVEPPLLEDYAFETPPQSAIAQLTAQVLREEGLPAEPIGVPFSCDASKLAQAGIPSIVLGPGSIDRAHAEVEYVELDQVEAAMLVYRGLMQRFEYDGDAPPEHE